MQPSPVITARYVQSGMGCGRSQDGVVAAGTDVAVGRRRLTVGIDDCGDSEVDPAQLVTEADRSLLLQLSQQEIFDFANFAKESDGRRYSIESQTDKQLNDVSSFGAKTTRLEGEAFQAEEEQIGYACKKGLKPEAPNQDSFLILKIEGLYALYGVFDGHGRKGHDVSNFIKDNMPKILFSQKEFTDDPQEALIQTFAKTQYLLEKATSLKTIDATRSGSTCSIVLHCIAQGVLYVAHVGDSRVVLGKKIKNSDADGSKGKWEAVDLTVDHKPDLPEERKRIESSGGMVVFDGGWNYRVFAKNKKDAKGKRYPGLNMSRSMGDLLGYHDAGISCEPEVLKTLVCAEVDSEMSQGEEMVGSPKNGEDGFTSVQPVADLSPVPGQVSEDASGKGKSRITKHKVNAHDKFILLCSDGVWEFIKSHDAVNEVALFERENAPAAAEHLCALAWRQWLLHMDGQVVDDITAIVVHVNG